ncbi:MAG: glycosyltransferase family 39 protein, partial [Anaerolineae bacterium]|nr:glycosyltransferase family 39 protein [Anaerolineae bacterium]
MRLHPLRHSHWLILGLLLFAFGLRVYGIEAVRHDFDRAYPHGAGIGIVEAISAHQWQQLPLLSLRSNINLPNPALASYLWAIVAAFPAGRDPYIITFVNVALNVLSLAMLADLARRLIGKNAAILAIALAASSLWSVYLAQGAWLQGLLEFSATFTLWAIIRAWQSRRPWRIFLALCVAALVMHTYLLAFGLLAQILAFGLIGLMTRKHRPIFAAYVMGAMVCVLGIAIFSILVLRDTPNILSQLQNGVNNASTSGESVPNPFGVSNTFAALYHAVGVITGRFYEDMWANAPNSYFGLRDWLSNARALLIEAFFALGVLSALLRRRFGDWITLAWFFVPVVGITLLTLFLPNLAVFHHYMMITAPGGYLLAGMFLGQNKLFSSFFAFSPPKWLLQTIVASSAIFILGVPALNFIAHVAHNRVTPFDEQQAANLDTLTIQHLRQIGETWRNNCPEIANPQHPNWV